AIDASDRHTPRQPVHRRLVVKNSGWDLK
ncbi:hypothetical protein B7494_g8529, partial [Chlorociboria aeruginascens]